MNKFIVMLFMTGISLVSCQSTQEKGMKTNLPACCQKTMEIKAKLHSCCKEAMAEGKEACCKGSEELISSIPKCCKDGMGDCCKKMK